MPFCYIYDYISCQLMYVMEFLVLFSLPNSNVIMETLHIHVL